MNWFRNLHYRVFLAMMIIVITAISVCYAVISRPHYPSVTLYQNELYGASGENLTWLEASEDGHLTAINADPAITMDLDEEIPIAAVRIITSDVTERAQLQLVNIDEQQTREIYLNNGMNIEVLYSRITPWTGQHFRLQFVLYNADFGAIDKVTYNPASVVLVILFFRSAIVLTALSVAAILIAFVLRWLIRHREQMIRSYRGGRVARLAMRLLLCVGASYCVLPSLRLTTNSTNYILCYAVILAIYTIYVPRNDTRTALWTGLFSILLAFACNCGSHVFIGEDPYHDLMDASYVTGLGWRDAIAIPVLAVVFYRAIAVLRRLYGRLRSELIHRAFMRSRRIPAWMPALVIWLCWMPYYILYYPGIVLGDSASQIWQSIGEYQLSNHHPVVHTLWIKLCIQIGSLYGGLPLGIAIYSMSQMILVAAMLGWMIAWLSRRRVPIILCAIVTAYYALTPFYGAMSIAMWKDPAFGVVAMVVSLQLYDYISAALSNDTVAERRSLRGIFLGSVALVFLRNNGVYVLAVAGVIVGIVTLTRKAVRRECARLLFTLASVVCMHAFVTGPVYDYYEVLPGEQVESVGLFLNQMASVAASEDGVMSEEDREFMDQLLPLDKYAEVYAPCCVDQVKWDWDFSDAYLEEHSAEFLRTYLSMALKNPVKYLNAWVMMTFGYWAPNYWEFNSYETNLSNGDFYDVSETNIERRKEYKTEYTRSETLSSIFTVNGSILSLGIVDWILLAAFLTLIMRRNTPGIALVSISLGVVATMLIASPYYYWPRYGTAQYYLLPVYMYLLVSGEQASGGKG